MRVLALVTDAYGSGGGIAQYNRDLIGAAVEAGTLSGIYILPRHGAARTISDKHITQLDAIPNKVFYAFKALGVALKDRPHIVFCGHLNLLPLAFLISILARAKLILQVHGIDAWERPTALLRFATDSCDYVLAVSRYTRQAVLEWSRIEPERLIVIPNTYTSDYVPELETSSFPDETAPFTLLSVSRLDPRERYKGIDTVIRALPDLIKSSRRPIRYRIGGTGEDRERLEGLASSLGVSDSVEFLGFVPEEDLPDLYRSADLFVLPSSGEGFGIVFLEAMACGTPALGLAAKGAMDPLSLTGAHCCATLDEFISKALEAILPSATRGKDLSQACADHFGLAKFNRRVAALFTHIAKASNLRIKSPEYL